MPFFLRTIAETHLTADAISAYVDGAADGQAQKAAQHLARCAPCQSDLESLQATRLLLRSLPTVPVPRSFALHRSPVAVPRPSLNPLFTLRAVAVAAMAALVIVVVADTSGLLGIQGQPIPVQLGIEEPGPAILSDSVNRPEAAVPLPPLNGVASISPAVAGPDAQSVGGVSTVPPAGTVQPPGRLSLWPLELVLLGGLLILAAAAFLLPRPNRTD